MKPSQEAIEEVNKAILGFARNLIAFDGTVTCSQVAGTQMFDFTYHQPTGKTDTNHQVAELHQKFFDINKDEGSIPFSDMPWIKDVKLEGDPSVPNDVRLTFRIGESEAARFDDHLSDAEKLEKLMLYAADIIDSNSDIFKIHQAEERIGTMIGRLLNAKVPPVRIIATMDRVIKEWDAILKSGKMPDVPFMTASEAIENAKKPTIKELLSGFESGLNGAMSALVRSMHYRDDAPEALYLPYSNLKSAIEYSKNGGPSVSAQWAKKTGEGIGTYEEHDGKPR